MENLILDSEKLNEICKELMTKIRKEFKYGTYDDEIDPDGSRTEQIDDLNDLFTDSHKYFIESPGIIEISENECHFTFNDENIFDLLGIYTFVSSNSEGKIVLFKKCIENFAKYFHEYTSKHRSFATVTLDDCIIMTYKIVLWHELGHWITHWMKDPSGKRWDDSFWSLCRRWNPNDLLEGLAQLFTYFAILNDADVMQLKYLFEFMLLGQSPPYHKHIEIMKHSKFSWTNSFKALELIRISSTPNLNTFLGHFRMI